MHPSGVLACKSRHSRMPVSELEKLLVAAARGSNTSWHDMIYRADKYAPHLSDYAGAAATDD